MVMSMHTLPRVGQRAPRTHTLPYSIAQAAVVAVGVAQGQGTYHRVVGKLAPPSIAHGFARFHSI